MVKWAGPLNLKTTRPSRYLGGMALASCSNSVVETSAIFFYLPSATSFNCFSRNFSISSFFGSSSWYLETNKLLSLLLRSFSGAMGNCADAVRTFRLSMVLEGKWRVPAGVCVLPHSYFFDSTLIFIPLAQFCFNFFYGWQGRFEIFRQSTGKLIF